MPPPVSYNVIILNEMLFIWIFFIFIFSWILVELWTRWLDNFTYITLKLDKNSPMHTFVIALVVSAFIITMIIYLKTCNCDVQSSIFDIDGSRNNSENHNNIPYLGPLAVIPPF